MTKLYITFSIRYMCTYVCVYVCTCPELCSEESHLLTLVEQYRIVCVGGKCIVTVHCAETYVGECYHSVTIVGLHC